MTVVELRPRVTTENPFIGLRPFGVGDADMFFGREAQVAKLLERLRDTRFLATVGASGCGKSSLVLAGLIPALQRGEINRAGSYWRIATMRPGAAPTEALATALARTQVLGEQAEDPSLPRAAILHGLQRGELGLIDLVYQARLREDENLLIVVDQFEELFRYTSDADPAAHASEAAGFVKLLLTAAAWKDLPIYVAVTMRSDFIGDCARFRDLPEAVNDGLFLVPRLRRDEMQRAIEEPVLRKGEHVAPRLVSRLLNDIGSDSDELPVLEHALMRTWNAWEKDHAPGEPLDVRHYELIGEMSGALSKHANDLYDQLDPRLQQVTERLFRCLTARDAENRGIRRPTSFGVVRAITQAQPGDVEQLFRMYSAPGVSFLTASGPPSKDNAMLDISHESLMRLWDRLRAWVDDEAESGTTYAKLVDDATAKRAHWINPELAVGTAWLKKNRSSINPAWAARYDEGLQQHAGGEPVPPAAARERFDTALAFLAASAAAPRRRLQTIALVVGIFFIVASALAVLASMEHGRAALAEQQSAIDKKKATAAKDEALKAQHQQKILSDQARQADADAVAARKKQHLDLLQAQKDKEDARKKLAKANRLTARARALANYNGGLALSLRDDSAGAIRSFNSAIRDLEKGAGTPADLAYAYYARGVTYGKLNKDDLARADFEHARRVKPDYPDPAKGLEYLSMRRARLAARGSAASPSSSATSPAGAARSTSAEACRRATDGQQVAAQETISRQASYDAARVALADNARCGNPVQKLVNEGYLRSTLAAAEHELRIGDWRADLRRADDLLAQCQTMPGLRGTSAAADCLTQQQYNDRTAAMLAPPSRP